MSNEIKQIIVILRHLKVKEEQNVIGKRKRKNEGRKRKEEFMRSQYMVKNNVRKKK